MHALQKPLNGWVVEPAHTEKGHYYAVDGEVVPSVTTVLKCLDKPALVAWAASQTAKKATELLARKSDKDGLLNLSFAEAQEIMEEAKKKFRETSRDAADIGTIVHKAVEGMMLGNAPEPVTDENVANGLIAFAQWKEANKVKPVRVEAYIASKKYKFGGTVDFIGYINDVLTVEDHKTSAGIYDEYVIQIAAYMCAVEEMTGKKIPQGMIVRFNKKDGSFNPKKDVRVVPRKEALAYFKMFKGLLAYYHAKHHLLEKS